MSDVTVVPSVYAGPGEVGDFTWMLAQPEFDDAFFVFNDNEQQFRAHQSDPTDPAGCGPGLGNGAIRPWQCADPPRAGGVPTGTGGVGYAALTPEVRSIVDEAVAAIRGTVAAHGYRRVFYSSDGHGSLGAGTFQVADDVKAYIVERLDTLAS